MANASQVSHGLVYSAAAVSRILGLPCECSDSVPEPADGETVVYYGSWDLATLRNSLAGLQHMSQNEWYDGFGWRAESGYYNLLLPLPNSNGKTWTEQLHHLSADAPSVAPVTVAATALLVHLAATGKDLLKREWCRCAEALPVGGRVGLTVYEGRVLVDYYWAGGRLGDLWLAGCRKY